MKRVIIICLAALVMLGVMSCHKVKVTRVQSDVTTDLSGRWNDTDAALVAQEMIEDVLSRPWYSDFLKENGRDPVIIVGTVRNLTTEHIDTDVFISDIERELINSGMVKFVASPEERNELRAELADQQSYSSAETMKKLSEETGADFMMQGGIKIILDSIEGVQAKFYQTDLQLTNLQTAEKVWIGTKKIKKIVSKGNYKF